MEKQCWNIKKIKEDRVGITQKLGRYIWLAKADTSQEAPASKSGSSSLDLYLIKRTIRTWYYMISDDNVLVHTAADDLMATSLW